MRGSELIEKLRARTSYGDSRLWQKHDPLSMHAADELEAQTALIAELVEALEACAEYFDNRADSYYDDDRHLEKVELRLYHAADAALSKAKP